MSTEKQSIYYSISNGWDFPRNLERKVILGDETWESIYTLSSWMTIHNAVHDCIKVSVSVPIYLNIKSKIKHEY